MEKTIDPQAFLNPALALLDETFDQTRGIYLDKDTSLFCTLDTINEQEASIPVGGKCASLAAQVAHVIFYLDVLERYVVQHDSSPADWGAIWRTVEKVNPQEWQALKDNLRAAYARTVELFRSQAEWNEDSIGGVMATIVHSAYHLGEIRQALCTLQPDR